ncbi:hypothetical protein QJQ45_023098, partial [Haematococcus lacustris]
QRCVAQHFPSALGVDDFMARLEVALSGFGFTGENSIAITNLCRDEVTTVLKDKIEAVFGSSFNTNGLGAVLTCGVTGMGAGFSHSPVSNGKEHYVFFAFPHIGINSAGEVGAITRPGRSVKSCACGALQKCLIELKAEGYTKNCKTPGVHNPLDPEYSILKQRLARRVRYEGLQPSHMDLVTMTQVAERTITNDLMFLIEKMVDPAKANYAVVTGVQIHNWAAELSASSGVPSLEFVAPTDVLVMRHGTKFHINLAKVPTMSPRQLRLFANASTSDEERDVNVIIGKTIAGTLKEIPLDYLTRRLGVTFEEEDLDGRDLDNDGEEEHAFDSMDHYSSNGQAGQAWQVGIIAEMAGMERDPAAPTMDSMDAGERYTSFTHLKEWLKDEGAEEGAATRCPTCHSCRRLLLQARAQMQTSPMLARQGQPMQAFQPQAQQAVPTQLQPAQLFPMLQAPQNRTQASPTLALQGQPGTLALQALQPQAQQAGASPPRQSGAGASRLAGASKLADDHDAFPVRGLDYGVVNGQL